MHRVSGADNPEAPIAHHWLDSTHIADGVVALGYITGGFKLEGSAFRGREPDENRYDIETGKLDSASVRLSYIPTPDWSLQVSAATRQPERWTDVKLIGPRLGHGKPIMWCTTGRPRCMGSQ